MKVQAGEASGSQSRQRGSAARWRRPTLKDVARLAGTSVITASRAINGSSYVSQETRKRVLEAVQALGYLPNAIARGLVTQRSQSVGVIISDITNPFFPQIIRGIEDALRPERYHVILADTDGKPDRDAEAVALLMEKQVDGLLLCASRAPDEALLKVLDSGIPVVLINRMIPDTRAGAVLVDGRPAARTAVEYLISLGHRRIACVTGPSTSWSSRERLAGYREALRNAGLPADERLVVEASPATMEGGEAAGLRILRQHPRPTAVFAFDDLTAIGVMRAGMDSGLRIPEDLSVLGFDDIELAAFISPPLTTVRQPKYDMGREAGEILLRLLHDRGGETPKSIVAIMAGQLIVRGSCAAAPARGAPGGGT